MEYFTLSEDLEKIRASKIKSRNRILTGLSIMILFFTLRGFGIIAIEFNRYNMTGNHQSSKKMSEDYGGRGTINSKNENLKTDDKYINWELKFNSQISGGAQNEYLEKLIKAKLSEEKFLSRQFEFAVVSVEKLEKSGVYWLPLIKSGKNKYLISVRNKVFNDEYSAVFAGETDFEVYGLCTVNKLDKIIAEKIAQIVVKSIKEDYKK